MLAVRGWRLRRAREVDDLSERASNVHRDVRHGLDIVWEVNSPAVPRLPSVNERQRDTSEAGGRAWKRIVRTSGDSSSSISAPRVSTRIAFAVGNDGMDIANRPRTVTAAGLRG